MRRTSIALAILAFVGLGTAIGKISAQQMSQSQLMGNQPSALIPDMLLSDIREGTVSPIEHGWIVVIPLNPSDRPVSEVLAIFPTRAQPVHIAQTTQDETITWRVVTDLNGRLHTGTSYGTGMQSGGNGGYYGSGMHSGMYSGQNYGTGMQSGGNGENYGTGMHTGTSYGTGMQTGGNGENYGTAMHSGMYSGQNYGTGMQSGGNSVGAVDQSVVYSVTVYPDPSKSAFGGKNVQSIADMFMGRVRGLVTSLNQLSPRHEENNLWIFGFDGSLIDGRRIAVEIKIATVGHPNTNDPAMNMNMSTPVLVVVATVVSPAGSDLDPREFFHYIDLTSSDSALRLKNRSSKPVSLTK